MSERNFDIVIIGAGHNGLVCAAYLLKAGFRVLLLEKRPVPGGAATTEELLPETAPGFRFNRCAIDHEFIFLGPVIQELGLQNWGLEYLFPDPSIFCPQPNGDYFLAHRSLERTCEDIARYSPADAQQYQAFIQHWQGLLSAIQPLFNVPPQDVLKIIGAYDWERLKAVWRLAGSKNKALDFIRTMLNSPEDVLNEWFDCEQVKAPLARLASEIGAPPSQKGAASGMMMVAMRHQAGIARPRGGTGALTQALVNLVQSLGGQILTEQLVKKILVEEGRAVGVETATQIYRASKGVVANVDARRVFLDLIDPGAVPPLRRRLERRIVNNNESLLKIDCALAGLPTFSSAKGRPELLQGTILIADSVLHVEEAHALAQMGRIPDRDPSLYLDIPTLLDPSIAPEGKHTLWIEFFAPYQIAGAEGTGLGGTGWTAERKEQVADRVIAKLAEYAPDLPGLIIDRHVESPAELGERLGAYRGNYYHLDMTLDQMMFLRPLPEIANYQTPVQNLYLTGAGTHPGGSISGMPGRNCARVFLKQRRRGFGRA